VQEEMEQLILVVVEVVDLMVILQVLLDIKVAVVVQV